MYNALLDELKKYSRVKPRHNRVTRGDFERSQVGKDVGLPSKSTGLRLQPVAKSWNTVLFVGLTLAVFLVFIARVFELQIIRGEDNLVLAEGNRVRVINIQPERGVIYDRNSEVLVRNKPAFGLHMDTETCAQDITDGLTRCLTQLGAFHKLLIDLGVELTDQELADVRSELSSGKKELVIKTGLTKEQTLSIEARLADFPGFSVSVIPQRDYLYGEALAHLVGYIGLGDTLYPTYEGKTGVEASYNDDLKGVGGGEIVQVDSAGQKVVALSEKRAVPGRNVQLNVDKELQLKAYTMLKEAVAEGKAEAGAIVAQDPATGGILALVSFPSYNPNTISSGVSEEEFSSLAEDPLFPFFNRAVSAAYPPASTFKIIMAAAALMEEVISEDYQILDNGFIQIGSFIYRGWKAGGHGLVDLRRALQVSNDIYFYVVGGGYNEVKGLGVEKIAKWAKLLGFGRLSGIDIPSEAAGFMPDGTHRDWYLGDTFITSIGQGDVLATPLQVNNVTAYFANGGYLHVPRVVKSVDGADLEVEVFAQNLVDTPAYEVIREGMNMAVEAGGTGYPLFDFSQRFGGIKLAGKTGTAEFGAVTNEDTHAWFTVFGPYKEEGAPLAAGEGIALTVFLEKGGSGADDASPIAKELLDYWFRDYASVPAPSGTVVESQDQVSSDSGN